ncbi:MAG: hypothetical protein R3F59_32910 [Myxococcota bacterium]
MFTKGWTVGWAALVLVACDGGSGTSDTGAVTDTGTSTGTGACTGTGTGTLDLTLGDAGAGPWAQAPEAVVYGPDGAEVARVPAGGSDTLEGLPGGTYLVEVHRGEGAADGALAGALATATLPLARVCVGDDATSTFASDFTAGAGKLWVTSGERIAAFGSAAIDAGGDQAPEVALDVSLVNDFRGLGFDPMGHLWAAASPTYGSRLLWWEGASGVGASDADGEVASLVFDDFAEIADLAFDRQGTLWAALRQPSGTFRGVVGYRRATLADAMLDGTVVEPDVMRSVDGLEGRVDLELGPDGALWITDYDGDRLLRIDDPYDGGTGVDASFAVAAPTPISGGVPVPLEGPENLAFYANGDAVALFWVSGALVRLPAADLGRSGAVDLVVEADDIYVDQLPTGLVVDGRDRAWLGNYAGDGTGQILGWREGEPTHVQLFSDAIPDPADLVLDPRPR